MTSETKRGLALGLVFIITFAMIVSRKTADRRHDLLGKGVPIAVEVPRQRPVDELPLPWAAVEGEDVTVAESEVRGPEEAAEAVQRADYGTYLVKKGDTFSTIAQKVLGTYKRWKEVHSLNKKEFPRPEDLREGAEIKVPRSVG